MGTADIVSTLFNITFFRSTETHSQSSLQVFLKAILELEWKSRRGEDVIL